MSTDIGKVFEKELEKVFRSLKETHCLGWHKFPDSAAAGGAYINAQPSDNLMTLPPTCRLFDTPMFFLEAKASETHKKLQMAMLRPSQRGAINFYSGLMRVPYLVFFWDVKGRRIEIWEGLTALSRQRSKMPVWVLSGVSTGRKMNIPALTAQLAKQLRLPPIKETLELYGETQ